MPLSLCLNPKSNERTNSADNCRQTESGQSNCFREILRQDEWDVDSCRGASTAPIWHRGSDGAQDAIGTSVDLRCICWNRVWTASQCGVTQGAGRLVLTSRDAGEHGLETGGAMEVYEMRGFLDGFGGVALRAPQDLVWLPWAET